MVFQSFFFFFFNDTATTEIYTLSLHDALPISRRFETLHPSLAIVSSRWQAFPVSRHQSLRYRPGSKRNLFRFAGYPLDETGATFRFPGTIRVRLPALPCS